MKNNNRDKIIFFIIILISFIAVLIYNLLTPIMSDDLMFDASLYPTIKEVFAKEYWQYMNWTGRSVLQLLLRFSSLMPLTLFQLINSVVFILLSLMIYVNVKGRKKYDIGLYVLIHLCLWNFSVDFSQTVLWMSGACNYLWGTVIILGMITLFRFLLKKQEEDNVSTGLILALCLLSVLAGWGNENTSGGGILILLLFTLLYYLQNRTVSFWMIAGIGSSCLGFLFLLLAPGNKVRSALVKAEESHHGLEALISRGLKVFKAIDEYLLLYLVVICILGVWFYYEKYSITEFIETAIFTVAGLATAAVLIFTPEPMPRAYFGANIFLLIAALNMVMKIPEAETLLMTIKTGGIIAGTLAFSFIYIEEGANLFRILRDVRMRENYILEEVGKGESDLTLPMLRPEFESSYSMAYLNDISADKTNWNNELFKNTYHIDQLIVLPWEEWEAAIAENGGK